MMKKSFLLAVMSSFLLGTIAGGLQLPESRPKQADAHKPQVGLAVGDVAPTFKARDQFGNEQSNSTILGKNGTVLLFFRSADW